jgi:hypothetical protein
MTKVLNRLRRAGSNPEVDHQRNTQALREGEDRVRQLVKDVTDAPRGEARKSKLAELREASAEVQRLRPLVMRENRARLATLPRGEKRTKAEVAARAIVNAWSLPSELAGLTLYPENLSEAEGEELLGLLELRHGPQRARWNAKQTARFTALVEQLAGWACFAELDAQREIERLAEEVRIEAVPRRVEYAEAGSVHLPAGIFSAMRGSVRNRLDPTWTVADVGALAVILACFETRDASVIEGGRFEEIDGEPVLVAKGRHLHFSRRVQPPTNALGESKVEIHQGWLEKSEWLSFERVGAARIEVRLGPRAEALRAGRPA